MKTCGLLSFAAAIAASSLSFGQTLSGSVKVHLTQPGPAINPGYYGLMTEEINHSYDGGLYAELIRNRSFRDSAKEAAGWSVSDGTMTLEAGDWPDVRLGGTGNPVELRNTGYWGIPVKPHSTYVATIRAKASSDFKGPLQIGIENSEGFHVVAANIAHLSGEWAVYKVELKTGTVAPTKENQFFVRFSGPGTVRVNYASLFPPTYHHRSNGFRPDLMEMLAQMKPAFLRMPGGNYLEGDNVATRFDWKSTLGDPMNRMGHQGPWGYRSSDGMGLLEFLEWCEDLKMKPLLAVYAGYSLRQDHVEPGPKLAPFVQDALDEIEYVSGDASTKWGAIRAGNGHPKPFDLSYVEIGNEDMFDRSKTYEGRFAQFFDAIRRSYPKLKLISTMPVTTRKADLVDDHYYRSSADMARDATHYDSYPRTDPKVFVGEWASTEGSPTPTLQAALGDAAWLSGLEHDSDAVQLEAYAPLLVNVNPGASQWGTNLIGYNALNSFGSPSFYVQSMFAQYTGSKEIPAEVAVNVPPVQEETPRGAVGLATWSTDAEFKDMAVTHDGQTTVLSNPSAPMSGWTPIHGNWTADSSEGAVRQTSDETGTLITAGDSNWSDYTYTLKAKKLSGEEGFIIPFHVKDDQNYWYWNVGGWANRRTALQAREAGGTREASRASRTRVETGRWYDVKVEVAHHHIRCYLDGQLVTEAEEKPQAPVNPIYVASSRGSNGALFLKVVNVSNEDVDLDIDLDGSHKAGDFAGLQLTGQRSDVNSVANPTGVAPTSIRVHASGAHLKHLFPARSVTVLRGKG